MPTKPITNLPEWADASNGGNYTGGPYAGQPRKVSIPAAIAAEGFRPGAADPSAAEHINDYLNRASLFIRWVFEGSSAGAADAHLLETNSLGSFQAQRGTFSNTSGAFTESLSAQAPPAAGNAARLYSESPNTDPLLSMLHDANGPGINFEGGAAGDFTCHGASIDGLFLRTDGNGADGIHVVTEGSGADGIRVEVTGTAAFGVHAVVDQSTSVAMQGQAFNAGVGGKFIGGALDGVGCVVDSFAADGLQVTGGNTGTQAAVRGTGKGAARGGFFTGGPSGADGIRGGGTGAGAGGLFVGGPDAGNTGVIATAGAGGGDGLLGTGTGASSSGVLGTAAREGVKGISTLAATGVGVRGVTAAAAGSSSAGVRGEASGDGVGVFAVCSANGHAVYAIADGNRATIMPEARATDPTTVNNGGIWNLLGRLSTHRSSVVRRLFDTAGGMAYAAAGPVSGTVDDSADFILTATLTGADAPAAVGRVLVFVSLDLGRTSGTPNATLDIRDTTANLPLNGAGDELVRLYQVAGAGVYERNVSYAIPYTIPATGNRTFRVALASTVAGQNVNYTNASIIVVGVF